jgi:hypothetical protein
MVVTAGCVASEDTGCAVSVALAGGGAALGTSVGSVGNWAVATGGCAAFEAVGIAVLGAAGFAVAATDQLPRKTTRVETKVKDFRAIVAAT